MVPEFYKFLIDQFRHDIVAALVELHIARHHLSLSNENETRLDLAYNLSQRIERLSNLRSCVGMLVQILNDDLSAPLVWQTLRESSRVTNPILLRELLMFFQHFVKSWHTT